MFGCNHIFEQFAKITAGNFTHRATGSPCAFAQSTRPQRSLHAFFGMAVLHMANFMANDITDFVVSKLVHQSGKDADRAIRHRKGVHIDNFISLYIQL